MTQTYQIRRGDTLGGLARRLGTTVDALATANKLKDPNRIIAGEKLKLPDGFDTKGGGKTQKPPAGDVFEKSKQTQTTQQTQTSTPTRTSTTPWRDEKTNRTFPARDGVPLYGQADSEWGKQDLGKGRKDYDIAAAGCAISACSMAVSMMSGKTFTPKEMDDYLDKNGGYSGDSVHFNKTGNAVQSNPPVFSKREYNKTPSDIDQQLAQGKPVVIGVDYKNGKGTDHWMTVTGKNADGSYNVNDPAGGNGQGRMIKMVVRNGVMQSADAASNGSKGRPYRFDGNAVFFSGGNPKGGPQTPGTTTTKPTTTPQTTTKPTTTTAVTTKGTTRDNDLTGDWKAKPGINPNQYDSLIRESSAKHGISPRLLKAMIQQESHFDPKAGSNKGAQGLVQIMPDTWKELGGGNPHDPKTNIDHAARYMKSLLKRYNGDESKALAAYNWGMGNFDKYQKGQKTMPKETRDYVTNITNSYKGISYK